MRLFKVLVAVGFVLVACVLYSNRAIKDDVWYALSPSYVAPAALSLAANLYPVPFCYELHADGSVATVSECRDFLLKHPKLPACAFQNLERGSWNSDVLRADPKHASDIVAMTMKAQGCEKVIFDFESLRAGDRDAFSLWSKTLIERLRASVPEVYVSIAVHAKTDDAGSWSGAAAQDWRALCVSADELLLMAYDFHYPGITEAGEQAPLEWVTEVFNYATSICPVSRLRLGMAAYGYEWPSKTVVTERNWQNRLGTSLMPSAPYFVETVQAREAKITLAHSFGLNRFFIWALGMEPVDQ